MLKVKSALRALSILFLYMHQKVNSCNTTFESPAQLWDTRHNFIPFSVVEYYKD